MTSGRSIADAVVAGAILIVAVGYLVIARIEVADVQQRDLLGQAGLPQAVAVITILCAAVILFQSLRPRTSAGPDAEGESESVAWRSLALWMLALVYVLTLHSLGFLLATAVFVAAAMWLMDVHRWVMVLLVGVGTAVALFAIFDFLLGVMLPAGFIQQLMAGGAS